MTRPAAYLRKSKDAATKQDHLAILMDTVKAYGHNGDTVVYDDWARSGDIAKLGKRTGWRAMCEAIERGEHDVVFMNDLDRGGRSIEEWARFMRVARDRGVRVVAGGVDWASPERKLEFHIRASFAEEELDRAKARAARTVQIRQRRGDATTGGHAAPYGQMWARAGDVGLEGDPRRIVIVDNPDEPMEPLLEAIRDTKGNVLQAARRLNERGVPTRSGRPWDHRVLSRALDRVGAQRAKRGPNLNGRRRAQTAAPLSRLVACHCGATMTPEMDPRKRASGDPHPWLVLTCAPGRKAGKDAHGPYIARARHVTERLRDELRFSSVRIQNTSPTDTSAERSRLEATRRKLGIALADDAISEDEYRVRMDAVKRALAALTDTDDAATDWLGVDPAQPLVDWDADDATVGEQLRRAVRVVRLGDDMLPASVEYRAPWITRAVERRAARSAEGAA